MHAAVSDRASRLQALRAEIHAIEAAGREGACPSLPFGIAAIDRGLAGGGMAIAALHEMTGASPALGDDAAASLFIAGIAARAPGDTAIWALGRRDLFAPGLALAGLTPDRLLYAECQGDADVLAVMEEGLRHGGLAAVVGEVGRADMAATRRLQLAAEQRGTIALLLRRWQRSGADPLAAPSAATTRWRIGCVPSGALPVEGIGRVRWRIDLARQRGGAPFTLIMEGTDETGRLALPADLRDGPDQADRAAVAA